MSNLSTETESRLRTRFREYLASKGYEVAAEAEIIGTTGSKHVFDMVARRKGSFTNRLVLVDFVNTGDTGQQKNAVWALANKARDIALNEKALQHRVIVTPSDFAPPAKELAAEHGIKIVDSQRAADLFASETPAPPAAQVSTRCISSRTELSNSLAGMGYRVDQRPKVKGKSGIYYYFDILAHEDDAVTGHTLGIDFLADSKEIDLTAVSLFEIKATDAGVDGKVLVVSSSLTPEAKLFARKQSIKVIKLEPKDVCEAAQAEVAEGQEKPAADKPQLRLKQKIQAEAIHLIPEITARRYNAIPVAISGNTLQVGMADPTDIFALEAFTTQTGMSIKPIHSSAQEVREAIDFYYKGYTEIEKHISQVTTSSDAFEEGGPVSITAVDAPLAQALDLIIEEAVKTRSSDIHIEPEENRLRIRYRIDGILHDVMSLPVNVQRAIISRIKILADMNIADHLRPQDGQFTFSAKGRDIDIRVAIIPIVWGEMAVLRILDKSIASRTLSELGFLPDTLEKFENMLKIPYGMILVTGPTGAGKTTTLYAAINSLDTIGKNVITIEDPAEYRFKDVNQIQVNPQAGITFAGGLRSILRLDPNVILVGEIRDGETAGIAAQAALTGHLMLSSLHASDSAGALGRLIDLGIEPFLVASSVICVVAQRMVRRICPDCGHIIEVPIVERSAYEKSLGETRGDFLYGTGCDACAHTGYSGRIGIFEVLVMSDAIRALTLEKASSSTIRAQAIKEGMITMMKDGMLKVRAEITTPTEVLRSAYSGD